MASYQIENDAAVVTVDEHASEIHSFISKDTGLEYMWNGDPKYWSGRNPTLFPMVGSTWDKKLHINGKEYETGNHGFARHSEFKCIKHTNDEIIMELKDNENTLSQYPFHFTMHISYTLLSNRLYIRYQITNDNDEIMPFNFGLHPAFRCPESDDEKFEDYHIEFDHPENINWGNTHLDNTDRLELDREALKKTIVIPDPQSTEATLTNGVHGVTVHYEGYEWLAFWSPEAPFVCIEPWHSHTDFEKVEVPFEKREGTLFLKPHESFYTEYSITVF